MKFTIRLLGIMAGVLGSLIPFAALAQRPSIAALQSQVTAQQARITALEAAPIQDLNGYVSMDLSTPSSPKLRIAGANLQVVNGSGNTTSVNGLGNIIIGYNETSATAIPICSDGTYNNAVGCLLHGTWAANQHTGSHNLVIGSGHSYTSYGGLVAGNENAINRLWATVTAGYHNLASGPYASISGGSQGIASGVYASISGGSQNIASNQGASVSGGTDNTASGTAANISGGELNIASGANASISGGNTNTASGLDASVSGGRLNTASGILTSVSGGLSHTSIATYNWRAGTLFETQ